MRNARTPGTGTKPAQSRRQLGLVRRLLRLGKLKSEIKVTDSAYQPFRHDLESPLGYMPRGLFIIVFRLVRDVVANHKTTRYAGAATKVIQKNHLA